MTGSIPDFQMSFCGTQLLISWLWDVDEFMALLLISVLLQIVCVFYSMITKKVMLKKYASYLLKKWFLFTQQMLNEEEKEPPLLHIYTHIGRHVSIRNERLQESVFLQTLAPGPRCALAGRENAIADSPSTRSEGTVHQEEVWLLCADK